MTTSLITKTSEKLGTKDVYSIEKDFSLNTIDQIKSEVDTIIDKGADFHLEMKNLDSFDLSSIQLIHAITTKMGDKFSFSLDVKEEIKTIINHSGFDYLLNK